MSASSPVSKEWLRQNYEKLLLVGSLVFLLISAAFLMFRLGEARRLIEESGRQIAPAEGQAVAPISLAGLRRAAGLLREPVQRPPLEGRMFSSELRVSCWRCYKPIEYHALKCPFCGADQPPGEDLERQDTDGDGIPDEWELAHGMDPMNPDDAHFDLDGDGFTALEEYRWGTDPRDPLSHPPWIAKLRVDRVMTEPFRFQFVAVQEVRPGEFMFQLNDQVRRQSYFRRLGAEVEGFTIEEYNPEAESLLLAQDDRRVTLVRGRMVQDDSRTVRFAFLIDRSSPEARLGQALELRGERYQVQAIAADGGVLLRDLETGEEHLVGPMNEADRRHMAGPAGMSAPGPGFEEGGLPAPLPELPRP